MSERVALVVTGRIRDTPRIAERAVREVIGEAPVVRCDERMLSWRRGSDGLRGVRQARLGRAIAQARDAGELLHVFAFASIPMLVQLGMLLGDREPVRLFQCHRPTPTRADVTWAWPDDQPPVRWHLTLPDEGGEEVVAIVDVSGAVPKAEIPEALRHLPTLRLAVDEPSFTRLSRETDLVGLAAKWREALRWAAQAGARSVHLFAAVPLAAAVTLGRTRVQADPALRMWEFRDGGWQPDVVLPAPADEDPWYDLFIGFQSDNRQFVREVSELLASDLEVFFDEMLRVGDRSQHVIKRALLRSSCAAFFSSPGSSDSFYLEGEIEVAVRGYKERGVPRFILPFLLSDDLNFQVGDDLYLTLAATQIKTVQRPADAVHAILERLGGLST